MTAAGAANTRVVGDRHGRLASRVRALRARGMSGGLDRWLLVIGGVLLPLGVLIVFLGWLGASGTVFVFDQIPYLISGGLVGLAVVFVGGFVYFSYWQTVRVREARAQHKQLIDQLGRIESALNARFGDDASSGLLAPQAMAADANAPFVATSTGTMFHRPDCTVVAGRAGLRRVAGTEDGLAPCRICEPSVAAPA